MLRGDVLCRTAHLAPGQPEMYYRAERTLKRAWSWCFWPGMRSAIEQYCESCEACESRRKPVPERRALLQSISADRPCQLVCSDITEMPVTSRGNRYVLVVQDHFTKYVNAYSMVDQKASTVAQRTVYTRAWGSRGNIIRSGPSV